MDELEKREKELKEAIEKHPRNRRLRTRLNELQTCKDIVLKSMQEPDGLI